MPNAGDDDVVDPLVRLGGGLPRHDPDRRAACGFRTARRCGHDLTAATRDHNATGLREQPADLLGARLVLGAAPDDGHLCCPHECDATAVSAERRRANGGTLVLGGGFAGSYVAKLLGSRGATIVSQETFMLYTPLLPEAASGTLEPRHTVVPLRQMCRHAELILGTVEALDEQERVVSVASLAGALEIEYEQLVIALGAVPRIFPVPGLTEHGRGFKDVADAIALRNHVLRRLEAAAAASSAEEIDRELGFVFVGAGYAGVEGLAELNDLAHAALRYYPTLGSAPQRWLLVDAAPKILAEIPTGLGDYAARQLARRGVEIRVRTTLESYDGRTAVLSDGARVPARTLVWTAGVRANPLLGGLGLPLDDRGRIVVDELLRVAGRENVWALGDCAAVPNTRTPGEVDPPTCQHALRQGAAWRRIWSERQGRTATACSARWRRWDATRASQTCSACACADSRAGS